MENQTISREEQHCISDCIYQHWSENSSTPAEQREEKYEQCLAECRICA